MNKLVLILVALAVVGCSKSAPPQNTQAPAQPAAAPPTIQTEKTPTPTTGGPGVKAEMRNVLFHLTPKAAALIESLSGELWPLGKNDMPFFDDKNSFEVRVTNGRISITPQALAEIMNRHVFAGKDAPLKDLSIAISNGQMSIKGKLSKGDISFETVGTLSVNEDGRLRVRTEKVKALHVPLKTVMGLIGIDLANVVNTSKIDGLDTDKNDLLMDLGLLLPPPHIRGKVSGVQVSDNKIVTLFGDGGKSAAATPPKEKSNYMYFQGNRVKFGRLTMDDTDLTILDLDPSDALEWSQDRYKEQLEGGYSQIDSNFGLRAYVKDLSKLPRKGVPVPARPAD